MKSTAALLVTLVLAAGCAGPGPSGAGAPGLTVAGGSSGGAADGMAAVNHYDIATMADGGWRVDGLGREDELVVSFTFAPNEDGTSHLEFHHPFHAFLQVNEDASIAAFDGEVPLEHEYLVMAVEADMRSAADGMGAADGHMCTTQRFACIGFLAGCTAVTLLGSAGTTTMSCFASTGAMCTINEMLNCS
jgi:hypothetical protein